MGGGTKKIGEWIQPVKNKRDEFVEWACSKGGLFSERALPTAYADNGGSSPNGKRLLKLQKRQEESHISTSRGNHLKKLLNNYMSTAVDMVLMS